MTEIPRIIFEQLEEVRSSGKTKMYDRKAVQYYADKNDAYQLVCWLEEHKEDYVQLLNWFGEYLQNPLQTVFDGFGIVEEEVEMYVAVVFTEEADYPYVYCVDAKNNKEVWRILCPLLHESGLLKWEAVEDTEIKGEFFELLLEGCYEEAIQLYNSSTTIDFKVELYDNMNVFESTHLIFRCQDCDAIYMGRANQCSACGTVGKSIQLP